MTDFKSLDPLRREANANQLDLVESFVQGKINRRHFIQRGTVLGLSLASISAIIAACGGSSTSPSAFWRSLALSRTATARASFAMYNTHAEVDKLAEALISAQRIFG